MYTLETFNTEQLALYRKAVANAFTDYDFTGEHISQMTSARAAVAQSMALANAIAGFNPRHSNERINANALRGAIGKMEAIASAIKFGGSR